MNADSTFTYWHKPSKPRSTRNVPKPMHTESIRKVEKMAAAKAAAFHDTEWLRIVEECADSDRLTPRQIPFVDDMLEWVRDGSEPTERQATWLRAIHKRIRK
jgi:hypothetical protein